MSNFLKYILKNNPTFSFNWNNLKNFKEMNWYKQKTQTKPNSNYFIKELTNVLDNNSCIIVDGGGTALYSGFQSSIIRKSNKIVCSSSISSMGTGLAETIKVGSCELPGTIVSIGTGTKWDCQKDDYYTK